MILALPLFLALLYFIIAQLLILFPAKATTAANKTDTILIFYGDIHTDIILNLKDLNSSWFTHIKPISNKKRGYLAIGWGDKESYLHPGSYETLPLSVIFKALFLNSPSLLHVSYHDNLKRYKQIKSIKLSKEQLELLNKNLFKEFDFKAEAYKGYFHNDYFYTSPRTYNLINTCNTWTGDKLREINVSMSYWTPLKNNVIDSLP